MSATENESSEATRRFEALAGCEPQRVDSWLASQMPELSRSQIKALIVGGNVTIGGHSIKPRRVLRGGERIDVCVVSTAQELPRAENGELDILFEDQDVVVLNKPSGLVVHPGAGIREGTMVNLLLGHFGSQLSIEGGVQRPGIVHRLDRQTSGCIAVARNDQAHRHLSEQLVDRTMKRSYLAWVYGNLNESSGEIEAPIGRSTRNRTRMAVRSSGGGRQARTLWEVSARAPGLTRLICRLETGRTHQIRVHMQHIARPVVGDPEYGPSMREAKMGIPPGHPKIIQAISRVHRQLLHAYRLEFTHPRSGEQVAFEAPLPEDFRAFDQAMEPFLFS